MLDEQSWREASAELIQDPQVRDALSVYLVNELYDNVDVSAALAQELPPALKGLAPTAAGALRQPATDAVDRLLDAPHVQQLFIDASSLAQSKLVNVLENKTGDGISTGNGDVTLDLGSSSSSSAADLGLPASALGPDPAGRGRDHRDALRPAAPPRRPPCRPCACSARCCSCSCSGCTRSRSTSPAVRAARRCATSAGRSCWSG